MWQGKQCFRLAWNKATIKYLAVEVLLVSVDLPWRRTASASRTSSAFVATSQARYLARLEQGHVG